MSPVCPHHPRCPDADAPDWAAAHITALHPEQGWSRLCNGAIAFDDGGALVAGRALPPRPEPALHITHAAA